MAIIENKNRRRHQRVEAYNDPMDTVEHIILLEKFRCERYFYDSVVSALEKMRPFLIRGEEYTWQELLGDEFWSDMPGLPIHLACLCLKHLAQRPDAPFSLHDNCIPYFRLK